MEQAPDPIRMGLVVSIASVPLLHQPAHVAWHVGAMQDLLLGDTTASLSLTAARIVYSGTMQAALQGGSYRLDLPGSYSQYFSHRI